MTNLGGSRSLTDTWTYVQPTEPGDRRNGVQWVNSETNVIYIYSGEYGDWMRQSRVWVQDTEPTPRVGPLDGDQWIDSSKDNRPTRIYSAALNGWQTPIPQETQGVASSQSGYTTVHSESGSVAGSSTYTNTVAIDPAYADGISVSTGGSLPNWDAFSYELDLSFEDGRSLNWSSGGGGIEDTFDAGLPSEVSITLTNGSSEASYSITIDTHQIEHTHVL